ncbi:MAG: hypothetical protein H7039_21175 [Bryobacteraceae bacterium]|nr:hypothetical protein [Bryobacteraceae bacterium]
MFNLLLRFCVCLFACTLSLLAQVDVSPTTLKFTYLKGTAFPASQPLMIKSQTSAQLPVTVTTNATWLTVSSEKGNTALNLVVSVNPTGLAAKDHDGEIRVFNPAFGVKIVQVVLTVSNPAGKLIVDPAGPISLEGRADDAELPATSLRIFTDGNLASFAIKASPAWLILTPTSGTAAAFSPAIIKLSIDPSAISSLVPIGQKTTATITVTSTGTPPSTATAVVNVLIGPGIARLVAVAPNTLYVNEPALLTLRGAQFYTNTTVTINNEAAKLTVLSPTLATLSVPPSLLVRSGTLNIALWNSAKDPRAVVKVPVLAPMPVISTVLNSASYELPADGANPFVSSGELVSIFGENLGPERILVSTPTKKGEYASTLGTTRVQVKAANGEWLDAVPLLSYSTQINALLPFELAGTTLELRVENAGVQSSPIVLDLRSASPGIFTMDSSGTGQAAVLNYDPQGAYGGLNSAQKPARIDSHVAFYATGCGAFTKSPLVSSVVQASPELAVTAAGASVVFDNTLVVPATWAGVVPGMVPGLCQINVKVPAVFNPHSKVPVNLVIDGHWSTAATFVAISN